MKSQAQCFSSGVEHLSNFLLAHLLQAMGSCLLSEANDLKRPLPIVAKALAAGKRPSFGLDVPTDLETTSDGLASDLIAMTSDLNSDGLQPNSLTTFWGGGSWHGFFGSGRRRLGAGWSSWPISTSLETSILNNFFTPHWYRTQLPNIGTSNALIPHAPLVFSLGSSPKHESVDGSQ